MPKNAIILFVLTASFSFTLMAASSNSGLIAYYPFDGNCDDLSGNNRHGILHGAIVTEDRNRISSKAYLFDGINDYAEMPQGIMNNLPKFTVSGWVKPGAGGNNGFFWGQDSVLLFGFGYDAMSRLWTGRKEIAGGTINLNEWSFLVCKGDNGSVSIYVNGVLKAYGVLNITTFGRSGQPFQIGGNFFGPFFKGAIDEVRVYNRTLSDTEILYLYNDRVHQRYSQQKTDVDNSRLLANTDFSILTVSEKKLPRLRIENSADQMQVTEVKFIPASIKPFAR